TERIFLSVLFYSYTILGCFEPSTYPIIYPRIKIGIHSNSVANNGKYSNTSSATTSSAEIPKYSDLKITANIEIIPTLSTGMCNASAGDGTKYVNITREITVIAIG